MLTELVLKKNSASSGMSEVEEVLQHAKDALARHHAWMSRRRNQRTVAPLHTQGNLPSDAAAERKIQPTSWAVGTPKSEKAPPPSSELAAAHPGSQKRAKISSNQIAPSVEWSPNFTDGVGERKDLSPNLKPIFISLQKEELERDSQLTQKNHDGPLGNGVIGGSFPGHIVDDRLEGKLELDQNGLVDDPNSSNPPPYVMSISSAWGEDRGNLETTRQTAEKEEVGVASYTRYTKSSMHDLHHTNTPPTATPSSLREPPITGTPKLPLNGTLKHRTVVIPKSPLPDNIDDPYRTKKDELVAEEDNFDSNSGDHYQMLQESSTARLVTVSPAPKSQRAKFSSRAESKLGLVDERTNAYDYSSKFRSEEGDDSGMAAQLGSQVDSYSAGLVYGTAYDSHVPGADFRMVRPAKEEEMPRAEVINAAVPLGIREDKSEFNNDGNRHRGVNSSSQVTNTHTMSLSGGTGPGYVGRNDKDLAVMDLEENELVEGNGVTEERQLNTDYVSSQGQRPTTEESKPSGNTAMERQDKRPSRSIVDAFEGNKGKKKTKKSAHGDKGLFNGSEKSLHHSISDVDHRYSGMETKRLNFDDSQNPVDENARATVDGGNRVVNARLAENDQVTVNETTGHDDQPLFVARPSASRRGRVPKLPHTEADRDNSKFHSPTTYSRPPLEVRATVATGDDNSSMKTIPKRNLPPLKARAIVATGDDNSSPRTTTSLPPLKVRATVATDDVKFSGKVPATTTREKHVPQTSVYLDGSQLVKELPPLRATSLLASIMEGISVHPKRSREPPGYDIHKPGDGIILSPPCPLYGEKQPPKQTHSAARVRSPPGGVSKQDRPAWSRSKSVGIESVKGLQRSSSTLVLNDDDVGTGSSLARTQSERDVSDLAGGHAPHTSTMAGFSPGPGPLHIAAKLGNLRRLQSLLDQGHDVDLPDDSGRTPLMYCIQSNGVHLSCADALIKYGAQLDKQTSDGATAVHMACGMGALSLLELLLLNNARADMQDFEGRYPIHWATLQNNTKVFTQLLKRCGPTNGGLESVDDMSMTVLMWAGYHDNHHVVSHLMDLGADTQEKDKDGYTAMHWSIHREGSRSLQLLLKPDMTYFKDHLGKTLMHVAAERGSMGACEVVLKLRPDAIHDRDKQGRTPLHYGAACSRVDVCALLLDYAADATQRDTLFKTPLDYAREKKLDYVVALLSCHGNAVADFARASRSVSVSSLLHRTISFSQLPGGPRSTLNEHQEPGEEGEEEELQDTSTNATLSTVTLDSLSTTTAGEYSRSSWRPEATPITGVAADVGDMLSVDPAKGGYLGRFFPDDKDLIRHYFFRLNESEGSILWSRSRESSQSSGAPSKALVLEVHREPSNTVKNLAQFSPGDLHCYAFWVGTSGGVLDLLAYNEDAYNLWLIELERVAGRNVHLSRGALQAFKGTSVVSGSSRPVSSSGTRYTARVGVSPGVGGASSSGTHQVGENIRGSVDASVFLSDRQNRNETSNDKITRGHNANIYTNKKLPSKGKQVAPLSIDHAPNSSPSPIRRSGLSFVGETFRSARPDALDLEPLPQGTVV